MTNPIIKERVKLLRLNQFGTDAAYPGGGTNYNDPHYLNVNRTTDFKTLPDANGNSFSPEERTFYSDYLLDNAEPYLVHSLFAQRQSKPAGTGDTAQFRGYNPYPKALTPLQEGVTPDGRKPTMRIVEAKMHQYGDYTAYSDRVVHEHPDNHVMQITKLHGQQMGRTLDTVYREVMNGGTNVQYGANAVLGRHLLVGGDATPSNNHYLTVDCIRRAVRFLKNQNADKIDGSFVAIIHPDVSYDLMSDPNWRYPHQYQDTTNIYEGEIGKIEGTRFVESTEAKVFHAEDLASNSRNLTVNGAMTNTSTITFDGGTVAAGELVGRYVIIGAKKGYVGANTTTTMTLYTDSNKTTALTISATDNTVIYPGEAGAAGRDVYSTLVLGDNAYGILDVEGENAETILKEVGSAGAADPLNQRGTIGWKATALCVRLSEAYMVRIETASTFELGESN